MSFTPEQKTALAAPLNSGHVKTRAQAGRQLSYIEGWWAIAEANRVFGFDGWNRYTTALKQLGDPREVDGKWRIAYMAQVRVEVSSGGEGPRVTIREGTGYGSGIDRDLGQAHESAIKEAETDAMKRALMTFGNPFGLALYDKEQNGVQHPDKPVPNGNGTNGNGHATQRDAIHTPMAKDPDIEEGVKNWCLKEKNKIAMCGRLPDLLMWKDEREAELHRLFKKAPEHHKDLMAFYQNVFTDLSKKEPT